MNTERAILGFPLLTEVYNDLWIHPLHDLACDDTYATLKSLGFEVKAVTLSPDEDGDDQDCAAMVAAYKPDEGFTRIEAGHNEDDEFQVVDVRPTTQQARVLLGMAERGTALYEAAPKLLEACEAAALVLAEIEQALREQNEADPPGASFDALYDAHSDLQYAIASARGEVEG